MIEPIKEKDVIDPLTHEHAHAGVVDPNVHHGHTPEEIRKEMKVYISVFVGLAILTVVTVVACYKFQLPVHTAIARALFHRVVPRLPPTAQQVGDVAPRLVQRQHGLSLVGP